MNSEQILIEARKVLRIEAEAIQSIGERLNDSFSRLVNLISGCQGKVILTGIGKSGIICRKIAATLSSTGTPSLFLHPAEAMHGDLGILDKKDLLMAVSNSGESSELLNMIFSARKLGVAVTALTGNLSSTLAMNADPVIDVSAPYEACPLGLAPTTSTTVALAIGDALAIVVMKIKGFKREDYAALHPGGNLGQRLKLKVRELMISGDKIPVVTETATLEEALGEMTAKNNLGITLVIDQRGRLTGVVTDGDVRRVLMKCGQHLDPASTGVQDVMTWNPKIIEGEESASTAVQMMESMGITSLAIVDSESKPLGILHLHDVLGRGNFII